MKLGSIEKSRKTMSDLINHSLMTVFIEKYQWVHEKAMLIIVHISPLSSMKHLWGDINNIDNQCGIG